MLRDQQSSHDQAKPDTATHAEPEAHAKTSFSTHGEKPDVARGSGPIAAASASDQAFGKDENKGALPESEKKELRHDVLFERLAHRFAYEDTLTDEDEKYLADHGLRFGQLLHGKGGLDMMTFLPTGGSSEKPVLAFRGTKGSIDVMEDANPAGVGTYQMAANEGLIAQTLASLHAHGAPTVTGHSLGGALAQMTASRFPHLVGHVVTFQSPGIPKDMVDHLDKSNADAKAKGGHEITSHHYGVHGDFVPAAGEAFTSGFRTIIDRGGKLGAIKGVVSDHTSLPLADYEKDGEPAGRVHDVEVNHRSTGGNIFHHVADAIRSGVGRVVEADQALHGRTTDVAYVHVWEQVRAAIDTNAKAETLIAIIEASHVRPEDKQLMIENLREIEQANKPTR